MTDGGISRVDDQFVNYSQQQLDKKYCPADGNNKHHQERMVGCDPVIDDPHNGIILVCGLYM